MRWKSSIAVFVTAAAVTLAAAPPAHAAPAAALAPTELKLSHSTAVGVHNTYDKAKFPYLNGSIDTQWYNTGHYLLVMTDASAVPPPIDPTAPTNAQALARIQLLAAHSATVVSADWSPSTGVLGTVVARG
jgi:hypothetical protein